MVISRIISRISICRNTKTCPSQNFMRMASTTTNGDLNNTAAERVRSELTIDPAYHRRSFEILAPQDDPEVRKSYRPFLQDDAVSSHDWVAELELSTVLKMVDTQVIRTGADRLRVLVLHGSMRKRY
jgi:arsenic resistance protein ArsH